MMLRLLSLSLLLALVAARAAVRCPPVLGSHMVLQRDRAVPIWGGASPGEDITVEFAGQSKSTVCDASGHWRVALDPLPASAEPRTLTVRGTNTLTFTDVLVGEVWFCSGQSNMEKPLGPRSGQKPTDDSAAEIAAADHPLLRLFQVPHSGEPKPGDLSLTWLPCAPDNIQKMQFSAAGYFFGRELRRELKIPIGLIHSSYGGTRIEAWMPPEAFAADPALRDLPSQPYFAWVKGQQATDLYRLMVGPVLPFAVRGWIWYQGEANCMNAESSLYTAKMRALIASWRAAWGDAAAPFYYVLLAPFNYSHQKNWEKQLTPDALPAFWEAQTRVLAVPHTGVIVTTDLVPHTKDIHPTNKRDIGLRLARLALADTYGRSDIAAQSPRFNSLKRSWWTRKIELTFDHADGLRSRDNQPLTHFALAGEDRKFHPADAVVKDGKVILSSPQVRHPVAVRFAWHEAAMPNLVNAAGLAAVPFRTDDWPLVLEVPKPPAPPTAAANPGTAPPAPRQP